MQLVVEFIAGLVTSLAVAVFAQFGIDLRSTEQPAQPEIHRTVEREPATAEMTFRAEHTDEC